MRTLTFWFIVLLVIVLNMSGIFAEVDKACIFFQNDVGDCESEHIVQKYTTNSEEQRLIVSNFVEKILPDVRKFDLNYLNNLFSTKTPLSLRNESIKSIIDCRLLPRLKVVKSGIRFQKRVVRQPDSCDKRLKLSSGQYYLSYTKETVVAKFLEVSVVPLDIKDNYSIVLEYDALYHPGENVVRRKMKRPMAIIELFPKNDGSYFIAGFYDIYAKYEICKKNNIIPLVHICAQ